MMFKGAKTLSQKCQNTNAPTSFYGAAQGPQKCQPVGAPKGRASSSTQKCQHVFVLPNQSHGAIFTPQQCQRMHAPPNLGHTPLAEMPNDDRPNNTDQRPIEKR